mmetsp:Transcript_12450/g.15445  ORF Transcript_12450/g.15445 Transcript_12450/m.15445 type:complete len:199 (+) Transcript_12450:113-709(+)
MKTLYVYLCAVLPALVSCYGGGPQNAECQSICSSFSSTVGVEFQKEPTSVTNVTTNSTDPVFSGCLFGQTAVENLPSDRCDPNCDANIGFECACVSKEDAESGLAFEAQPKLVFGFVSIGASGLVAGLHYYLNRRKKEKMLTVYKDQPELAPDPKPRWYLLLAELLLVIVGIVLIAQSFAIKSGDYWEGCGLTTDVVN